MSLRERLALFGQKSLETGALVVGSATIVGSLLSVLKNVLLASRFGASAELDVYFAAFRIPDLLYGVFIFSALSTSFLPVFSNTLLAGKERAWKLASALMTFFTVFLGVGALAVLIASRSIAQLLAPGFSALQIDLLSSLLRILMIQPILMALASLFADISQSFKRFFVSTLAPVFYNGGTILGIVLFSQRMGIYGVVWGALLGSLLYAVAYIPILRSIGFRFSWSWRESMRDMRDVFALMVPRACTLIANNAVLIWGTMLSSLLPIGSLSIYSFTDSLQSLPQTMIALSFVTVAFPLMSQQWSVSKSELDGVAREKERAVFVRIFDATTGQMMAWLMPISLALVAFSSPVVRVLLGHGNFNVADQHTAAIALVVFALGIPAQGLLMHLVRTFFAMEDVKHPLFATFLSLFIVFPSMWFCAIRWGVPGMIAGIVLGAWFNTIYLLWLFIKLFGTGYLPRLQYGFMRGTVVGIIASCVGSVAYYGLGLFVPSADFWIVLARSFVAGSVFVFTLGLSIFVYKLMDLSQFLERDRADVNKEREI